MSDDQVIRIDGLPVRRTPNYGDSRQQSFCVFCGGTPDTKDHLPSRVFLDQPYPEDLAHVPACRDCNNGFSLDEEYVAVLLEGEASGSCPGAQRPQIRKVLDRKPKLRNRVMNDLASSLSDKDERIKRVLIKLARGHVAYDLNDPQLDEPTYISLARLQDLSPQTRKAFETPPAVDIYPEVGSRSFLEMVSSQRSAHWVWVEAQRGRYRYLPYIGDGIGVRMVIGEFLAGEVIWL